MDPFVAAAPPPLHRPDPTHSRNNLPRYDSSRKVSCVGVLFLAVNVRLVLVVVTLATSPWASGTRICLETRWTNSTIHWSIASNSWSALHSVVIVSAAVVVAIVVAVAATVAATVTFKRTHPVVVEAEADEVSTAAPDPPTAASVVV